MVLNTCPEIPVAIAGLAMGVALLGLPWKVIGVMLAGTREYYSQQQHALTEAYSSDFLQGMPYLQCLGLGLENFIPASHLTKGIMSVSVHFLFSCFDSTVLIEEHATWCTFTWVSWHELG